MAKKKRRVHKKKQNDKVKSVLQKLLERQRKKAKRAHRLIAPKYMSL